MNCSSLPTGHRLLLPKCCESSYLTLCCIVLQRTDWLIIVTEINKVCKKTNSHFLLCRSCWDSIKVTCRLQLRCDVVFMSSSPSSSPRFSLLAGIFRTTLNKITSRRFQQHLRKARFCSGISFHLFIFTYSQLSQYHRPSARSKSLSPCHGCQVVISKKGQINPWKKPNSTEKTQIHDKYTITPSKHPNALLKGTMYIFYT